MTEQPRPPATRPLASILTDLTSEVKGLRSDVQAERTGRHLTTLLAAIELCAAVAVGAAFGANIARSGTISCEQRAQGRSDTRAAIAIAVDKGAAELGAAPARRKALGESVSKAVYEKLPPPDC